MPSVFVAAKKREVSGGHSTDSLVASLDLRVSSPMRTFPSISIFLATSFPLMLVRIERTVVRWMDQSLQSSAARSLQRLLWTRLGRCIKVSHFNYECQGELVPGTRCPVPLLARSAHG